MNEDEFAAQFETLFRETYRHAVRRIRDKRHRLSPESTAFLNHLSDAGPMTLTELARHTDRAQSTMSEMVHHLVEKGLLERDSDPKDARRALIWLSEAGQEALAQSMAALDPEKLERAAGGISKAEQDAFLALFKKFVSAFK